MDVTKCGSRMLLSKLCRRLSAPTGSPMTPLSKASACCVTIAGAKSFVLTYRRKSDGKQRRVTIGTSPDWTTTAAREEAKRLKREIDGGGDPVGEQQETRTAPTIAELATRFIGTTCRANGPSTQRVYRQQFAATSCPPSAGRKSRR